MKIYIIQALLGLIFTYPLKMFSCMSCDYHVTYPLKIYMSVVSNFKGIECYFINTFKQEK